MDAPMNQTTDHLSIVRHVILVLSGKGGVGKSTVGLLDVDLCGPSIPRMFNVEKHDIHQCPEGWLPVFVDKEQQLAVIDVVWRDLDYLIIDTPPGTSDEHITVVESLKSYNPDGAILVTTPQAVAVGDVRRELTFCKKTHMPVIGIIENMSGFVCPHCTECTNLFSKGGGEALAKQFHVPFLGKLYTTRLKVNQLFGRRKKLSRALQGFSDIKSIGCRRSEIDNHRSGSSMNIEKTSYEIQLLTF
ncbi:hypothetical protein KUTeg_004083 [Tegillarca granosa]|uniref:Cytosolic Fe-S cluster assembly factor NUBP2 n=1 Tax=Tegillarca granosa TaxID=220873 RepID=A0ABQ9FQS8_TEGGR|nr:hypothetical protein KUTeg_004083 [Tegillarca granosa]